ncbi:MAG: anion permease, partial [Gammaproteobacteria bacterium]
VFVVLAVLVTLVFDFTNGFHDASNIIATIVASRAMTPIQAVVIVAFFEFLGPMFGGTAVADTIGGFVHLEDIEKTQSLLVVLSGLLAASFWNLFTWRKGIPSSSSHALIGGLAGAVIVSAGPDHVLWGLAELERGRLTGVTKVLLALFLSPPAGFLLGFFMQQGVMLLLRSARPSINRHLRRGQWLTAAGLAFSHGANDAQKSMGILTLILLLGGYIDGFSVPFWVIASCATAMTGGVLLGGWRIVRTLGFAIYKIRPVHALNSQLTACSVILSASLCGAPVSTTHVVASSIMGIGAADRPRAVHWSKAREILTTWLITIPNSGLVAGLAFTVFNFLFDVTMTR